MNKSIDNNLPCYGMVMQFLCYRSMEYTWLETCLKLEMPLSNLVQTEIYDLISLALLDCPLI